jgi:hypothetical protein
MGGKLSAHDTNPQRIHSHPPYFLVLSKHKHSAAEPQSKKSPLPPLPPRGVGGIFFPKFKGFAYESYRGHRFFHGICKFGVISEMILINKV